MLSRGNHNHVNVCIASHMSEITLLQVTQRIQCWVDMSKVFVNAQRMWLGRNISEEKMSGGNMSYSTPRDKTRTLSSLLLTVADVNVLFSVRTAA